ncbi:MAG: F420-dependent oxidoreductase [Candidatus Nanopelagicales bacterium]|nr:F420-dependent oxidoreductase [Candidatus Nanopelagicales bacterium]
MSAARYRWAYSITCGIAGLGLAIGFSMVLRDTYPSLSTESSLLGSPGQPLINRIVDYLSFFTIWSNIVVAIVAGYFVYRPRAAVPWFRTLWLSALLMISATGLIYHFALADLVDTQGAAAVSNACNHILTPLAFVLSWLIAGPRGWISPKLIMASFILPLSWILLTLSRGAVIDAYPYPFVNVVKLGYGAVLTNLTVILLACCVLALLLWGIDKAMVFLTTRRERTKG